MKKCLRARFEDSGLRWRSRALPGLRWGGVPSGRSDRRTRAAEDAFVHPDPAGFTWYLSLALEFQLAADILSTAIAPTWEELGKLGVTATIRTALNYFLSREMKEYTEKVAREESTVARRAGA